MSTKTQLLDELNELRHLDGQAQLKSWNGSKESLEEAIDELKTQASFEPGPVNLKTWNPIGTVIVKDAVYRNKPARGTYQLVRGYRPRNYGKNRREFPGHITVQDHLGKRKLRVRGRHQGYEITERTA